MAPDPHKPLSPETFTTRWERAFERIVTPFEEFVHRQTTGGMLLMGCTLLALLIANSRWGWLLEGMLNAPMGITLGGWELQKSVHLWINDGLMALFFFVVGLEIKREMLVGELAEPRHALLPIIAALGGMVAPATIYALFNLGSDNLRGWGIPMATDIAFAVGVMVLLGPRVPRSLFTFLVALAIVDDLGAVVVIALFYTATLDLEALGVAVALLVVLALLNRLGVRRPMPYFAVGALLWLVMLKSGVHATLAGVATAMFIPARPRYDPCSFSGHVRRLMDHYDDACPLDGAPVASERQLSLLRSMENGLRCVTTPLQHLESTLHQPVAFLILPLFALANAGIPLHTGQLLESFTNPLTLGVMSGLLIGKPLGIALFSWLAIRSRLAALPTGADFRQIIGVGIVGGIGFTMSLFVTELAFGGDPGQLLLAKSGIFLASLTAGACGYLFLRNASRTPPR